MHSNVEGSTEQCPFTQIFCGHNWTMQEWTEMLDCGGSAKYTRISGSTVFQILRHDIKMCGSTTRWVPYHLNGEQCSIFWHFADRASQYLTNLMHKICFTVSFIQCLYMFRAHVLIIRRSKLHYTAVSCTGRERTESSLNPCMGRPPIGVMIPQAV